jgi:hypothetical protein
MHTWIDCIISLADGYMSFYNLRMAHPIDSIHWDAVFFALYAGEREERPRMVRTATYKEGRLLGWVIWSGRIGEVPVNFQRFFAAGCYASDEVMADGETET